MGATRVDEWPPCPGRRRCSTRPRPAPASSNAARGVRVAPGRARRALEITPPATMTAEPPWKAAASPRGASGALAVSPTTVTGIVPRRRDARRRTTGARRRPPRAGWVVIEPATSDARGAPPRPREQRRGRRARRDPAVDADRPGRWIARPPPQPARQCRTSPRGARVEPDVIGLRWLDDIATTARTSSATRMPSTDGRDATRSGPGRRESGHGAPSLSALRAGARRRRLQPAARHGRRIEAR